MTIICIHSTTRIALYLEVSITYGNIIIILYGYTIAPTCIVLFNIKAYTISLKYLRVYKSTKDFFACVISLWSCTRRYRSRPIMCHSVDRSRLILTLNFEFSYYPEKYFTCYEFSVYNNYNKFAEYRQYYQKKNEIYLQRT